MQDVSRMLFGEPARTESTFAVGIFGDLVFYRAWRNTAKSAATPSNGVSRTIGALAVFKQ